MWEFIKDLFATAANIIVIVAGLAGTYLALFYYRDISPKMNVSHDVEHRKLSADINLLRVSVVLENTGKVKNTIRCEMVRVDQVRPLPGSIAKNLTSLNASATVSSFGEETWQSVKHLDWEQVKIWSHDYSEPSMPFIEPGEKDALEYEFFLPAEIETVKIYSYYMNENESPSRARCIPDYRTHAEVIGRGWTKTTLYDLR